MRLGYRTPIRIRGEPAGSSQRRLMTLIENMLTTAKIEMGGFTSRRSPVDLAGLSNAVKYTPKGGHVAGALAREGGAAVLSVADTGIGIPATDQPGPCGSRWPCRTCHRREWTEPVAPPRP